MRSLLETDENNDITKALAFFGNFIENRGIILNRYVPEFVLSRLEFTIYGTLKNLTK